MGLFDRFKKKKAELSDEQQKWNIMWDMWSEGKAESPYEELMTYQSEVNNGGHDQYFLNVGNTGDIQKEMSALKSILSEKLTDNLEEAYRAYLILDEKDDEKAEEIIEHCDDVFFENENEINCLLEKYAAKIEL